MSDLQTVLANQEHRGLLGGFSGAGAAQSVHTQTHGHVAASQIGDACAGSIGSRELCACACFTSILGWPSGERQARRRSGEEW
ncbi:hypothetical protein AcV5_005471 [Taiwanofungus camphoratus]|nr:hypothetical protein AcV5_005471 [Antrodia cinnamomea]